MKEENLPIGGIWVTLLIDMSRLFSISFFGKVSSGVMVVTLPSQEEDVPFGGIWMPVFLIPSKEMLGLLCISLTVEVSIGVTEDSSTIKEVVPFGGIWMPVVFLIPFREDFLVCRPL